MSYTEWNGAGASPVMVILSPLAYMMTISISGDWLLLLCFHSAEGIETLKRFSHTLWLSGYLFIHFIEGSQCSSIRTRCNIYILLSSSLLN